MSWAQSTLRKTKYHFAADNSISGSMIEAGSDTTSQALNNTIIGLLSNPDAIRKAQEELDRVVGPDRTPTFEDAKNLPYIRAIVKVESYILKD